MRDYREISSDDERAWPLTPAETRWTDFWAWFCAGLGVAFLAWLIYRVTGKC